MGITERRVKTVKTIRSIWSSLESHLDHSVKTETNCESCGTRNFHAKCVAEYAEQIKDLADTL